MAVPQRAWAANLLHVWFHQLGPRDWFSSADAVNAMLRARFERDLLMMHSRPAHEFLTDPKSALAAILLFDQIPRNLYGGTAEAFAFDPLARAITHGAIQRGWDRGLTPPQRQFLAMPMMHSEHIADQLLSLRIYAQLPRHGWAFARSHYKMIARFGRYPHRNDALGRKSTAAEKRAVAAGNSW